MKTLFITGVSITTVAMLVIFTAIGVYNSAVTMEENINTAESNITKEEKRRLDLFNNLVDAIESYNQFEQETFAQITEARARGNNGEIDEAFLAINAVAEAYPDLKSQQNYQNAMLEFSITENRIAGYREQFNNDVRSYKAYTRKLHIGLFLSIAGYEPVNYQYLDYDVSEPATGLFGQDK